MVHVGELRGLDYLGGVYGLVTCWAHATRTCQVVVKCTVSNMLLLTYEYDSHKVLQRD